MIVNEDPTAYTTPPSSPQLLLVKLLLKILSKDSDVYMTPPNSALLSVEVLLVMWTVPL